MPSLSIMKIKIHEPSLMVNHSCVPNDIKSRKTCYKSIKRVNHVDNVPNPLSLAYMQVVAEILSSPSSCVTASQAHDQHQLHFEAFFGC